MSMFSKYTYAFTRLYDKVGAFIPAPPPVLTKYFHWSQDDQAGQRHWSGLADAQGDKHWSDAFEERI